MDAMSDEARTFLERGRAAERGGDPDAALRLYAAAAERLRGAPSAGLADALRWMGTVHRELGNSEEAEGLYYQSMAAADRAAYAAGRAHALNCLGLLAQRHGALEKAERLYHDASRLAEQHGETCLRGMVQHNLGIVADIRGDREGARSCFVAALDTFRAAEHPQGEWEVLNSLGMLECKSEHFAASEEAFARGIELARAAGARAAEGILETNRADMRLCAGRLDEAEEGCARALAVAEERGDPLRMAEALRVRARVEEERDRLADALADLEQARALAAAVDDALLAAEVLRELGEVWRRRGETGRAREALGGALRRFAEMGAARDAAQVEATLAGLAAA